MKASRASFVVSSFFGFFFSAEVECFPEVESACSASEMRLPAPITTKASIPAIRERVVTISSSGARIVPLAFTSLNPRRRSLFFQADRHFSQHLGTRQSLACQIDDGLHFRSAGPTARTR